MFMMNSNILFQFNPLILKWLYLMMYNECSETAGILYSRYWNNVLNFSLIFLKKKKQFKGYVQTGGKLKEKLEALLRCGGHFFILLDWFDDTCPFSGKCDCKSLQMSSDWSLLSCDVAFLFYLKGSGLLQGDPDLNHRAYGFRFDGNENYVKHMLWHSHMLSHSSNLNLPEHLREILEWHEILPSSKQ